MTSRSDIMEQLSSVPMGELLSMLEDKTVAAVAAQYFAKTHRKAVTLGVSLPKQSKTTSPQVSRGSTKPKTAGASKRPLNAFMAFRSYYLKLFPYIQQKSASGFLTALWNKDPHRNKWTLIAKVYSFIRDQVGKSNIVLSAFLSVSCPTMGIIDPSVYLQTFGWSVEQNNEGYRLHQDKAQATDIEHLQSDQHPTTEFDLLAIIIKAGYFANHGPHLLKLMKSNASGIMTVNQDALEEPGCFPDATAERIELIRTVGNEGGMQLAKKLMDQESFEEMPYLLPNICHVGHFDEVSQTIIHVPMVGIDFHSLAAELPPVNQEEQFAQQNATYAAAAYLDNSFQFNANVGMGAANNAITPQTQPNGWNFREDYHYMV